LKTTKLLVVALLLLVGFTASTNAQFYVKVGAGYGILPLGAGPYDETPTDTTNDPTAKGLGQGIYPNLGLGYMVNKYIGIELNGYYTLGTKIDPYGAAFDASGTRTAQLSGIFFAPGIVVNAPLKSVTPFARVGLLLGIPQVKHEWTDVVASTNYAAKYTDKGGLGIGMEAGLGIGIKASKKLNVFIELFGNTINFRPTDQDITETNYPGSVVETRTYATGTGPFSAPTYALGTFGAKVGVQILFGTMPKK